MVDDPGACGRPRFQPRLSPCAAVFGFERRDRRRGELVDLSASAS